MPAKDRIRKGQDFLLDERPRGRSREAREEQMIGYAEDLAEYQMRMGTASPSIIGHYLKLASTREELEKTRIEYQTMLFKAKADEIDQRRESDRIAMEAVEAMKRYSGNYGVEDVTDEML